jgi:ubiquinone/menaquinone biosynthesis C-methylase UbiE
LSLGDSERQAFLRDQMIKKKTSERNIFVSKILSILKPQMKVLDVGCGTAHIIRKLAKSNGSSLFIGLDVSLAMLEIAYGNTTNLHNIGLVKGDGRRLPFHNCSFDVVITKLADYSPHETYRVLRRHGHFLEYGLGPEADREIKEFFPERIEKENFFFPTNLKKWKQEVCEDIIESGFGVSSIEDFKGYEHCENERELMDLIEMVPLVKKFDRAKDREKITELVEKYGDEEGVKITWHHYIMMARKS